MPIYPADPNAQALLNRVLDQPTIGSAFDAMLKLRLGEQQNAMQMFEMLARANPALASFVTTQTGLPKALTSTPPTIRKKGEADMGTQVQQAFLEAAKASANSATGALPLDPKDITQIFQDFHSQAPSALLAGPDGPKAAKLYYESRTNPERFGPATQELARLGYFVPKEAQQRISRVEELYAQRDLINASPLAQQMGIHIDEGPAGFGTAIALVERLPDLGYKELQTQVIELRAQMARAMMERGEFFSVEQIGQFERDAAAVRERVSDSVKAIAEIDKNLVSQGTMLALLASMNKSNPARLLTIEELKASLEDEKKSRLANIEFDKGRLKELDSILSAAKRGKISPQSRPEEVFTGEGEDAFIKKFRAKHGLE